MCTHEVKSLKQLAINALPRDTTLADLPHDILILVNYNRTTIRKCIHNTTYRYKYGNAHGIAMHACGCSKMWKDGKCTSTSNRHILSRQIACTLPDQYLGDCGGGGYACWALNETWMLA